MAAIYPGVGGDGVNEQMIVNQVTSQTTTTAGRALNSVRAHHFVIDEPAARGGPGEEISPAEAFLAGVSACGVLLVETFARESGRVLASVRAVIEGVRRSSDPSRFEAVNLRFEIAGVPQHVAEDLVERYEGA